MYISLLLLGRAEFGVQEKRCYRCQRLGHWAGKCRASWPVSYRPNRSGFTFANPTHENRPGAGGELEVQVNDENSDNPKDWIYQVLDNEHECELETVVTPSVKGRLKEHIPFWIKIDAPNFVLSVIQEGNKIPFIEIPPVAYLRNKRHKDFVQQAISELLQCNRVIKANSMPHVVNPLSVSVQPSGKLRLILDLRHVNNYVRKQNIKYEDWKTALTYFHKAIRLLYDFL